MTGSGEPGGSRTSGPCRWFLVRHGETEWNRAARAQGQSDPPLNDEGRAQARRVAGRLSGTGFQAAYASDLLRAVDTARPVVRPSGVRLVTLPELREKNFGEWEGLTHQEVATRYPRLYDRMFLDDPAFAPPGGESDQSFFDRVASAVGRIRDCHSHAVGNLLVVAHGGTLRAMIITLLGLPVNSMWRFRLSNAGLSIVTMFGDGSGTLDLLNDTSHLGAGFDA